MTRAKPNEAQALTRLFELASRSLHSAGYADGLYPAQWTALRYLARAAPRQRTSMELARFQQISAGPVSRTVRSLIAKNLVVKAGSAGHGRSEQLDLTDAGRAVLEKDPLAAVGAIFSGLTGEQARLVASVLGKVASELQTVHGHGNEGLPPLDLGPD